LTPSENSLRGGIFEVEVDFAGGGNYKQQHVVVLSSLEYNLAYKQALVTDVTGVFLTDIDLGLLGPLLGELDEESLRLLDARFAGFLLSDYKNALSENPYSPGKMWRAPMAFSENRSVVSRRGVLLSSLDYVYAYNHVLFCPTYSIDGDPKYQKDGVEIPNEMETQAGLKQASYFRPKAKSLSIHNLTKEIGVMAPLIVNKIVSKIITSLAISEKEINGP
jgi:hypothetical protein